MNKQSILALVIAGLFSQTVIAETSISSTSPEMMETSGDSTTMEMTETLVEEGTMLESSATAQGDNQALAKISDDFSGLLGDSASEVVSGLRNGEEFTLTNSFTDAEGVQITETVTIDPPTGKMGNGNVYITLGLAEHSLAQLGITDPTALDLEAALLGGSITTTDGQVIEIDGVLALRSEGMGWGKIAQQYDTKLGHVMSSLKSGKVYTAPTTGTSSATNDTAAAGQTTETASARNTRGQSAIIKTTHTSNGHAYGRGIVTATGSSVGSIGIGKTQGGKAQGNAYGHVSSGGQGIVSAGGGAVHGNAGGNGQGKALGKGK